jgi:hypothetical protein
MAEEHQKPTMKEMVVEKPIMEKESLVLEMKSEKPILVEEVGMEEGDLGNTRLPLLCSSFIVEEYYWDK